MQNKISSVLAVVLCITSVITSTPSSITVQYNKMFNGKKYAYCYQENWSSDPVTLDVLDSSTGGYFFMERSGTHCFELNPTTGKASLISTAPKTINVQYSAKRAVVNGVSVLGGYYYLRNNHAVSLGWDVNTKRFTDFFGFKYRSSTLNNPAIGTATLSS